MHCLLSIQFKWNAKLYFFLKKKALSDLVYCSRSQQSTRGNCFILKDLFAEKTLPSISDFNAEIQTFFWVFLPPQLQFQCWFSKIQCRNTLYSLLSRVLIILIIISIISPQTKWRLPFQYVSDDRCLTINVCGRAHRSPICYFAVFCLQTATRSALFHHSVFNYFNYTCFTVKFHRWVEDPYVDQTYICNLELRQN